VGRVDGNCLAHRFRFSAPFEERLDAEGKRINPDSTEDLSYFDESTKQRFYPHVIEPAAGLIELCWRC
jgi:hypothetical protein